MYKKNIVYRGYLGSRMVQSPTSSGRNSGVECLLPKQDVVGSNPIARSTFSAWKGDILLFSSAGFPHHC